MDGGQLVAGGVAGPVLSLVIFYLRGWLPKLSKIQTTSVVVVLVLVVSVIDAAFTTGLHEWFESLALLGASVAGWYAFVMKGLGLEDKMSRIN